MIVMALLGAGVGLGVWLALRALFPRPVPLPVLLSGLSRPGRPQAGPARARGVALSQRSAQAALRLVEGAGANPEHHRQALDLVGRRPDEHALAKVAGSLLGLLVPVGTAPVAAAIGMSMSSGFVTLAALAGGVVGFMAPDVRLKEAAQRRQRAFRHALSGYLDLVSVVLAGGGGIETALNAAAEAGGGWAFARIREALRRAQLTGRTPWEGLAALGDELGVPELDDLAASVALAGSHGTRIREALASKADVLRGKQIAETEALAREATERMVIPMALLLLAFLIFIAYPAVYELTSTSPGP